MLHTPITFIQQGCNYWTVHSGLGGQRRGFILSDFNGVYEGRVDLRRYISSDLTELQNKIITETKPA